MEFYMVCTAVLFITTILFAIMWEIEHMQNNDLQIEVDYYKSTTKCFCDCEEAHQCELKRLQAENEVLINYIEKLQGRDIDNGKAD